MFLKSATGGVWSQMELPNPKNSILYLMVDMVTRKVLHKCPSLDNVPSLHSALFTHPDSSDRLHTLGTKSSSVEIVWEMAAIEGLKHAEYVHQKLHFWKFLWTVCSTTQSTVESMMTQMMRIAFTFTSRNHLSSSQVFVLIQWIRACLCGSITAQRL